MKQYLQYILISFIFFIFGIIFFAYQESLIIINIPQTSIWKNLQKPQSVQVDVQLFAFKNNSWIKETKQIIKSNDLGQTVQNLINAYFLLLEEEHILKQSIIIESCVLSPSKNTLFISLNHNPFNPQATTFECMMIIEGIMKTIRENKITVQSIQFLIHHKPWSDHRINMDILWPISGYITL